MQLFLEAGFDEEEIAEITRVLGEGMARLTATITASFTETFLSAGDSEEEVALRFAVAQLGKPYVYGGNGPYAFDCSGLVQQAWRAAGIRLPRTTTQQADAGTAVPLSQIQPGDLVIFYADASHVGIYAGGQRFFNAPFTGANLRFDSMAPGTYRYKTFIAGARITG